MYVKYVSILFVRNVHYAMHAFETETFIAT